MKNSTRLKLLSLILIVCTACNDKYEYNEGSEDASIILNPITESLVNVQKSGKLQNKTTKGAPTYTVADMANMSVFSYYTQSKAWSTVSTTATPNRMNNQLWSQTNGSWSTSPKVMWDATDETNDNYSFFSYAPMADANNGITVTKTTGTPTIKYTVPTTVESQPDITVATAINMRPSNGRVNLVHKHALTAIAIRVYGQGESITKVRFRNISTQGTLSLDNSNGIVWSSLNDASTNTTEYSLGLNSNSGITTTTTPASIVANNGYLMMIPQALTEDASLIITIDGVDLELGVYNQDVQTWEPGTIVTYTINTNIKTTTVDYTSKELANCYIINPSATDNLILRIPVKRVLDSETYKDLTDGGVQNWKLGLSLQSNKNLFKQTGIRFTGSGSYNNGLNAQGVGYENSYFELYIPKSWRYEGYFTISLGVGTTSEPRTISTTSKYKTRGTPYYWNWTFWVTDYNPYGPRTPIEYKSDGSVWAWSVPGGKLYNVNGSAVMDRDLLCYSFGMDSGALYQYGRKDPFRTKKSTFFNHAGVQLNYSEIIDEQMFTYSVHDHIEAYVMIDNLANTQFNIYDWCSDSSIDSSFWKYATNNKKSIYDPSPIGFRVPPASFFSSIVTNKNLDTFRDCIFFRPEAALKEEIRFDSYGYFRTSLTSFDLYTDQSQYINRWYDNGLLFKQNLATNPSVNFVTQPMYLFPVRSISLP